MKMLAINPISFKKRMMEFLFDYLFILAYLMVSQSLQKFSRSGLYF